jgi:hypothetical protein
MRVKTEYVSYDTPYMVIVVDKIIDKFDMLTVIVAVLC